MEPIFTAAWAIATSGHRDEPGLKPVTGLLASVEPAARKRRP